MKNHPNFFTNFFLVTLSISILGILTKIDENEGDRIKADLKEKPQMA